MSTDPLFGGTTPPAPVGATPPTGDVKHLDQLVGEGKKFKDAEALARAKAESDSHIARLERETAQMRQELDTRLSYEEFLEQIKAREVTPPVSGSPNPPTEPNQATVTKEDITRLVVETLTLERSRSQQEQNVQQVASELSKVWGSDYKARLATKQAELGLGKDFLMSVAASSPTAFLKLVGAEASNNPSPPPSFAPPPNSRTVQPQGVNSGVKNYAYYENLRKTDPRKYYSVAIQREEHDQALALGDDFGIPQ